MIYFDHNATSPLSATARDAWLAASERFIGNPSSPHRLGARAEVALSEARETAAAHLGCSPFDIVWTSGADLAIRRSFMEMKKEGVVRLGRARSPNDIEWGTS